MFDKLKDTISHAMYCWISVQNTKLIDNDYLGLWYQIVECLDCEKQSIIFRKDWNMYIEHFDNNLYYQIKQFNMQLDDYYKWVNEMYENNIQIVSNVNEIIDYPIWVKELIIYSTQDLEYGTEKIVNMPFYEAINYIRPN